MVNWTWNFQDGTPLVTVQNTSHTFQTAGPFDVTLVVWNATDTDTAINRVNVFPLAQFTATPTTGYAPLSVQFTDSSLGNPDNWTWQFGEGNISHLQSPQYTFTQSGVYTVNLTSVKNSMSNTSANRTITVNPKADFTITPSMGYANTTSFRFNASSTTGGPTLTYNWGFEAWNQSWSGPAVFNRTFDTANTYTINLHVIGNGGTSDNTTRTLAVYPVAKFTATPPNVVEGRAVIFDGNISEGNLTSSPVGTWSWNFGDGTTASGRNVTHGFARGKYTVSLTVTKNGLSNSTTTSVSSDSGNLYLLRTGVNGNTYFRADRYGVAPGAPIWLTAYSTRSIYSNWGTEIRPPFTRPDTNTRYTWEFFGSYDPVGHHYGPWTSADPSIRINTIVDQNVFAADIYTVKLTVSDSRDTFTVTKPRLIVVRN